MGDLVEKALSATGESKQIEFKSDFDPAANRDWVEVIKDIAAIANSGGGVIVFGLDDEGEPTSVDLSALAATDPADWTNKIFKYTGYQFSEFEVSESEKHGNEIVVLRIEPIFPPLVFTKPGTFEVESDKGKAKQKNAFSKGTIYFRHGAKSDPANRDDLQKVFDRQLESVRQSWLDGVRRITDAPPGATVNILPPEVRESTSPEATPIRLTTDPSAPGYKPIDPDVIYPFRQKELVEAVNRRLPSADAINGYDILAVRRVEGIDAKKEFFHEPLYSSPQYSQEFANWLVERYAADSKFFRMARYRYSQQKTQSD